MLLDSFCGEVHVRQLRHYFGPFSRISQLHVALHTLCDVFVAAIFLLDADWCLQIDLADWCVPDKIDKAWEMTKQLARKNKAQGDTEEDLHAGTIQLRIQASFELDL